MAFKFNPTTSQLDLVGSSSGSSTNSFVHIQPDNGTTPTATSPTDTLTLTSSDGSIIITGDSGTDTINFQASAGLEPGGSPTQLQYNNSGVFGGVPLSSVDNIQSFVGIQQSTPIAPLHITGASGELVAAPASASASLTLDTAVDSPTSYAVSQLNGPAAPSISGPTLVYIEPGSSGDATQNTGETGYVATGQTITYNLYGYRTAEGGVTVVNPNPFTFTMTDTLNDGSSFGVDIADLASPSGQVDGFILWKQDDQGYGPYWINLSGSGTTSYTDLGYTNQDPYVASAYQSNGSSWASGLANYYNLTGPNLRSDYAVASTSDDSSGNYIIIANGWGAPAYVGYSYALANGSFQDLGTDTGFNDYGQSGSGDVTSFASVAFPNMNTSLSDGSEASATQDTGESGYTADGSFTTHYYAVYEYRTNAANGVNYFTSGYTFTFNDNGDNSTYGVDIVLNPGSGDGRVLLYSLDGGSSYSVGVDLGSGTTYSDTNSAGGAPAITPLISSYTGITHNFSLYGMVSSPADKYSSTHNDQTFTDDNSQPYLIQHTYSGLGNASVGKIIDTSLNNHPTPDIAGGTIYQGPPNDDGNTTTTPATLGYVATGQVVDYHVYANKVIDSISVYSSGYADASVTFPNDGLNYYVTLTNASVAGATYKARRTINAGSPIYQVYSSSPYQDNISSSWSDSSTLAPTSAPITGAIIERSMDGTLTDPPIARFRNTNSSTGTAVFNEFDYNTGSSYSVSGKYGVRSNGNFFIDSQSHGLEIGSIGSAHTRFQTTQTVFNLNSSAYEWFVRGQTLPYLLYSHSTTNQDTILVGNQTSNNNYNALLNVVSNSNRQGIAVTGSSGATSTTEALRVENNSATKVFGVDQLGRMVVASSSSPTNANLTIGAGGSSTSQIVLINTSTLPTSPIAGGIERFDSNNFTNTGTAIGSQFTITDKNSHRYSLLTNVDPATGGSGNSSYFWVTGDNGMPKPTSIVALNSTNTILVINGAQTEFKSAVTTDNGVGVSVGGALTAKAGTGSTTTVGGTIVNHFADVGNSGTSTTTLYTDNLSGGDLAANGNQIEFTYNGIFVGSTSTKQLQVTLDGTTIFDSGALAVTSNSNWIVRGRCMRDSATTARCMVYLETSSAISFTANPVYTVVTVANWTATRVLLINGTAASTGAATNDIVAKFGKIEWK